MKKLVLFLVFLAFMTGCTQEGKVVEPGAEATEPAAKEEDQVAGRNFYLGVVPTPKNQPDTTWDDIVDAYKETGEIAEVTMIWSNPSGIGQHEKLRQNQVITAVRVYNLKPVVTLSFATIKEVPGKGLTWAITAPEGVNPDLSDAEFRRMWVSEARTIAGEFKPEYFSLGNEINDYFYLHPEELDSYLSLFDEAYSAIKEVSPDTKVFVVLSYTHLIDTGQWELLEKFDRGDMIGLTTYPWKHYDDPEDIPDDYYVKLKQYTDKPVAFTEIGWISSGESSEEQQKNFLVIFLERTKDVDKEMVNWLFLHEVELTGIVKSVSEPETGTIALKRADGTKKEIYDEWVKVKQIDYVSPS